MQTFIPLPDFAKSAKVLDYRRLGKQRVETWQILNCLCGSSKGWNNHPAVKMWKGYEGALIDYGIAICNEWIIRGYKDTMLERFKQYNSLNNSLPTWFGQDKFHSAHRQTLLYKNFNHYKQFGWTEEPKYEYWWPV